MAVNPRTNIVYVANDDGIYRSTDFGDSYTDVGTGLQTGQFYNGFACSSTDSLIALGQSQDHIPGYRYLGGPVWDHNSANDEAGWTAINPSNDNIMYAVARFGSSILRSTDRGASFSTVKVLNSTGAWNSPIVVANSNPNVLYMGDVQIHKSTNSGGVWVTMNGGNMLDFNPVLSMAVSATDANIVYAGTAPIS